MIARGDGRGAGEREQGPVASAQRGQSANVSEPEDHVSMAPAAGRRLWEMAANTRGVLAVEWLAACQGVDLREGLTSSPLLEQARHLLREQVAHYDDDRFFAPDIDKAIALLEKRAGGLTAFGALRFARWPGHVQATGFFTNTLP